MLVTVVLSVVLGYADSYLYYLTEIYQKRVEYGYTKGRIYTAGRYSDLDFLIQCMDKAERELRAICDVTGLNFWALFDVAKYVRRVNTERCNDDPFYTWIPSENEIEILYNLYDHPGYETGIYKNEFYDRAIIRLEDAKYERRKAEFIQAEYD